MVRVLAAFVVSFIAACGTVPPAIIPSVDVLTPIPSKQAGSKTIYVSGVTSALSRPSIGQLTSGNGCLDGRDLHWKSAQTVLDTMQQRIISALSGNGYNVYSRLIKSREKEADVVIGVGVTDVKANLCYSTAFGSKGEAFVTLTWEILDNARQTSITLTTSGAARLDSFGTADPDLFLDATTMAAKNLMANPDFFKATHKAQP